MMTYNIVLRDFLDAARITWCAKRGLALKRIVLTNISFHMDYAIQKIPQDDIVKMIPKFHK